VDQKTNRMYQWTVYSLFDKGTEIMFGLLKTEIRTNDFSKFSSKPTENNTSS
jgi:hypothetical protein